MRRNGRPREPLVGSFASLKNGDHRAWLVLSGFVVVVVMVQMLGGRFFRGTKRKENRNEKKGRGVFFQPMVGVVMVVDFLLIPIAERSRVLFFRIPRRDSRGCTHLSCRR